MEQQPQRLERSTKPQLAVLVSGRGTTLDNLAVCCAAGTLNAEIAVVFSNRLHAGGLEIAKKHGIVPWICTKKYGPEKDPIGSHTTEEWSHKIFNEILSFSRPDLVVLAGFDQLLRIPDNYLNRVVNIHPSLLPKYGGKGMYGLHVHKAVIDNEEKVSGCTVHVVDNEYDHGTIISQKEVPVLPDDTPESLQARVQEAERELYPLAIQEYLPKAVLLKGDRR